MMAAGLTALAACEEITNQEEQGVVSMTSFGFYTEDNNEVLSEDIVVDNITSNAITVRLPYGTTEEALQTLVPRFTVTEGASVLNGTEEVISGETAVDFSAPVDLVVSLDGTNAMYTVTVIIMEPAKWSRIAESDIQMFYGPLLAINPDGVPYLFGNTLEDEDTGLGRYPNLLRLEGNSLVSVAGNLTEAESDMFGMAIGADGTAYVAFEDEVFDNKLSVMKVQGNTASYLGNGGDIFQPGGNPTTSVAILPLADNNIWLASRNEERNNSALGRRLLNLSNYNGSIWTNAQAASLPGWPVNDISQVILGKIIDGIPYLYVLDYSAGNLYMYKYVNDTWEAIFEAVVPEMVDGNPMSVSPSTIHYQYGCMDFDVAANGDIYVLLAAVLVPESTMVNPAVIRYDIETGDQTIIGGVMTDIDGGNGACRYLSMALGPNDIPYVVLGNAMVEGQPVYVTWIDPDTRQWVDRQVITSDNAQAVAIRFAEDGTGYIALKNEITDKFELYSNASQD